MRYMKFENIKDPFNDNVLSGRICLIPDYRYGSLLIDSVNDVNSFQEIFCTPKIRPPKVEGVDAGEKYKVNKGSKIEVYERRDATNICMFSYCDSLGKRYITFKPELSPVCNSRIFNILKDVDFPTLDEGVSLSFDIWGNKIPRLVEYQEPLGINFLFGINQSSKEIIHPRNFLNLADKIPDPIFKRNGCKRSDFASLYFNTLNKVNNGITDDVLLFLDPFEFYIYVENGDSCSIFKCYEHKITFRYIFSRIFDCLDFSEDIDELVKYMIQVDFSKEQVKDNIKIIHKSIKTILKNINWKNKVVEAFISKRQKGKLNDDILSSFKKKYKGLEYKKVLKALKKNELI